jgi:hypothetical protein
MNAARTKTRAMGTPAFTPAFKGLFAGLAAMALVAASGTAFAQAGTPATKPAAAAAPAASGPVEATLIFKNGRVLTGTIVSETPVAMKFKGESHGIPFETEYQKSEILEIKRGAAVSAAPAAPTAAPAALPAEPESAAMTEGIVGDRVYVMELTGKFAEDITLSPIRSALRDARNQKADTLIIVVNNTVFTAEQFMDAELEAEATTAREIRNVEPILSHLIQQMPRDWETAGLQPPRMVTLVKKAMGGTAFIPLVSKEIYFAPEGKLGGVGSMDTNILGIGGSRRVLEKWLAASLQTAVGWVNHSGYPQPEELTRALTMVRDVYTLRIENGKPVLVTGYPANPSELLLTDDGAGPNADNIEQIARGMGNDVLTITADLATMLGLSKGTVSSQDELLQALGYTSANLVKSRADNIMRDWSRGLISARADLRRLRDEYGDIRVEGEWTDRRNARSSQISKIEQMKQVLSRFGEGLPPRWLNENGFAIGEDGLPDLAQLTLIQDQIRAAQLADRR